MEITTRKNGTETVVVLDGRLDTITAPDLEEELNRCIPESESVTLDFAKLDYISSAGLRVLLATHRAMSKKGGMRLIHLNEEVREVFEITGFGDMMNIE